MNNENLEADNALTIYAKRKNIKPYFDVLFKENAISAEEFEVALRVVIIRLNELLVNWQKTDLNKDDLK